MLQRTLKLSVVIVITSIILAAPQRSAAAEGNAPPVRTTIDKLTATIVVDNRPVLHYRCLDVPKKPYADQLFSPAGVQVLRDAPADHLHHHGLMYALNVDGIGYWEESKPDSGVEKHRSIQRYWVPRGDQGDASEGFQEQLDWIAPASGKSLLEERREIVALTFPGLHATLVEWHSNLRAAGEEPVTISGAHYYGLGLRFVESMDKGGKFLYADDVQPIPFQRQDGKVMKNEWLTPVKWCAYRAKADGKPVTVAVFDHPANLRYPSAMYTLAREFAYISATLDAQQRPIKLKPGPNHSIELCYGVAVWDGEVSKADIEKLYTTWIPLTEHRRVDKD
jgi:hypothetical protein